MKRLFHCLALLACPAFAQDSAVLPRSDAIVQEARDRCASEEAGELVILPGAVTVLDLDGDEEWDDAVVDWGRMHCQFAGTLWAGTGGSPVHFVLNGETSAEWFGWNWRLIEHGGANVILLSMHGAACDTFGASPCVLAIAPTEGGFTTVLDTAPLSASTVQ